MGSLWKQTFIVLILALLYTFMKETALFKYQRLNAVKNMDDIYDNVIVGAGSAGCVLASRLTEDKNVKVLLLEAGDHYDQFPLINVPLSWLDLQHTEFDWSYFTEPQSNSHLGQEENRSFWPRGRVLGGSGSINALQYTRGSSFEYDEWAANGCTGWSYEDVLPYFLKSEDIQIEQLKSSKYHNSGGPLAVSTGRVTPLADLYMKAGQEMGYTIIDYNSEDQEGFSGIQINARNGIRSDTGHEYFKKIDDKLNLHIALSTVVTKVEIKDNIAIGVFYIRNGKKHFVNARKEVILSSGAINSPQLLMLSGIGPKAHLEELKIPVIKDLPVGENLQDHIMLPMFTKVNKPYSIAEDVRTSWLTYLKYYILGRGPMSLAGADGFAYFYLDGSKKGETYADILAVLFSGVLSQKYAGYKKAVAKEYCAENSSVHGFNFSLVLHIQKVEELLNYGVKIPLIIR